MTDRDAGPERLSDEDLEQIERRPFEAITEARAESMARELLNRRRVSRNHASEISAQELRHEAAYAELRSLRAENEKLARLAYIDPEHRFPDSTYKARYMEPVEDLRKAEAHVEKLREALRKYGRHALGCAVPTEVTLLPRNPSDPRCDCGLRAALEGGSHD